MNIPTDINPTTPEDATKFGIERAQAAVAATPSAVLFMDESSDDEIAAAYARGWNSVLTESNGRAVIAARITHHLTNHVGQVSPDDVTKLGNIVKSIGVPTLLFYHDEYGDYIGRNNDALREQLREIDGIPNASYLVKGELVFVFDKLVQDVAQHQLGQARDTPLAELALRLLPDAFVTPMAAVTDWNVMPQPYQLVGVAGRKVIRHGPFDTNLPGTFKDEADAAPALANLLVGGVQAGREDFEYRGQPMTLCNPLDPILLPVRPDFRFAAMPADIEYAYTALGRVNFEAGFDPIPESLFTQVKELEATWVHHRESATAMARDGAATLWATTHMLSLASLNKSASIPPEHDPDDEDEDPVPALRSFYPELNMLSDGNLYWLFDAYQTDCGHIRSGWMASRDDKFLFYLLGKIAVATGDDDLGDNALQMVGTMVAYALLRGDDLHVANAFGRAARLYDWHISRLAGRVASAISFVAVDKLATDLRGSKVSTFNDMFRMARSSNIATFLVAEQSLSDFQTAEDGTAT